MRTLSFFLSLICALVAFILGAQFYISGAIGAFLGLIITVFLGVIFLCVAFKSE